jgi:hypothetical protein
LPGAISFAAASVKKATGRCLAAVSNARQRGGIALRLAGDHDIQQSTANPALAK